MGALECKFQRTHSHASLANKSKPNSLTASGSDMVYAQAIYAIIGAIALERGGAVANRIARDRVLQPLGIGTPPSNDQ